MNVIKALQNARDQAVVTKATKPITGLDDETNALETFSAIWYVAYMCKEECEDVLTDDALKALNTIIDTAEAANRIIKTKKNK